MRDDDVVLGAQFAVDAVDVRYQLKGFIEREKEARTLELFREAYRKGYLDGTAYIHVGEWVERIEQHYFGVRDVKFLTRNIVIGKR